MRSRGRDLIYLYAWLAEAARCDAVKRHNQNTNRASVDSLASSHIPGFGGRSKMGVGAVCVWRLVK